MACSTAWWTSCDGTCTVSRTRFSGSSSTWVCTRPFKQNPLADVRLRIREGCRDATANLICQMNAWTLLLLVGVSALWVAMLSAVLWLAAGSPARSS